VLGLGAFYPLLGVTSPAPRLPSARCEGSTGVVPDGSVASPAIALPVLSAQRRPSWQSRGIRAQGTFRLLEMGFDLLEKN
jgi:hypothetical protein